MSAPGGGRGTGFIGVSGAVRRGMLQQACCQLACPGRPVQRRLSLACLPSRLQGSTAISSDSYFGREQRHASSSGGGGGGGDGGMSPSGSSRDLDLSAGDLVSKISLTARQDMDSIKQVLHRGARCLRRGNCMLRLGSHPIMFAHICACPFTNI